MRTTTGVTAMPMAMREDATGLQRRELFKTVTRKAGKTNWDQVIVKADKMIARAGAVILVLSALYFVPVFVSILMK